MVIPSQHPFTLNFYVAVAITAFVFDTLCKSLDSDSLCARALRRSRASPRHLCRFCKYTRCTICFHFHTASRNGQSLVYGDSSVPLPDSGTTPAHHFPRAPSILRGMTRVQINIPPAAVRSSPSAFYPRILLLRRLLRVLPSMRSILPLCSPPVALRFVLPNPAEHSMDAATSRHCGRRLSHTTLHTRLFGCASILPIESPTPAVRHWIEQPHSKDIQTPSFIRTWLTVNSIFPHQGAL
ncbi:hypothetical protein C8R43DRAFT_1115887 [Mycena crocata]|nr:hypothetical protein C8R43DRAFT_1115887 [Mycena crocata]